MGIISTLWIVCRCLPLAPKMFGKNDEQELGLYTFLDNTVCSYGVFFPMHFVGMAGYLRRYYENTAFPNVLMI